MENYSDVLDKEATIERVFTQEFDFGDYSLVRVNNHWEIQFEDEEGAQSIVIQPDDFDEKDEFQFMIDTKEYTFPKSSFLKVENFCLENHLI